MNVDFKYVGKHLATRPNEAMNKVLMKPEAEAPEVHYYMMRGGVDQREHYRLGAGDSRRRVYQDIWALPHRQA